MSRSDAKNLITLLSIYSSSSRQEQELIIQELTNNYNIKDRDLDFIYKIENAVNSIYHDIVFTINPNAYKEG